VAVAERQNDMVVLALVSIELFFRRCRPGQKKKVPPISLFEVRRKPHSSLLLGLHGLTVAS